MKVLVVDSSVLIIERWQDLLSETKHITAVYGAVSYQDGYRFLNQIDPGIVLLDSGLDCHGWENLLEEIKRVSPDTMVIVTAIRPEDPLLSEKCRTLGADYLFDKYEDIDKISGTIQSLVKQ